MTIPHKHKLYNSDNCMECLEETQNSCKDRYQVALAHFQQVVDNLVAEMIDSADCDAYVSSDTTITESFDVDLHDSLFLVMSNALESARSVLDEYRNVGIVLGMKDNRCDEYLDDEGTYLAPDDDEIDDDETDEDETPCCRKRCDGDERFCHRTHFKRRAD